MVNSQARALPPKKLPMPRNARRQASWKMSSASVRSPASQRASANASSRWGETTRSNRALSSSPLTDPSRQELSKYLYRVPEIVTLGRLPGEGESDSRWRTKEVRHVGSDTLTPGFRCVAAAQFGQENQRRSSGPAAFGACGDL